MLALQRFARPASSIDPSKAAAACGTEEHRSFAAAIANPPVPVAKHVDPTEWRPV
jgi:hypothetical protein